jgi:hypothetical protein
VFWQPLTDTISVLGTNYHTTVPSGYPTRFFRLRR